MAHFAPQFAENVICTACPHLCCPRSAGSVFDKTSLKLDVVPDVNAPGWLDITNAAQHLHVGTAHATFPVTGNRARGFNT